MPAGHDTNSWKQQNQLLLSCVGTKIQFCQEIRSLEKKYEGVHSLVAVNHTAEEKMNVMDIIHPVKKCLEVKMYNLKMATK